MEGGSSSGVGVSLHTRLAWWVTAAALVFFTLYLAPNRIQVLYWRSGMFPYLAPLAAQAWLAAAVLRIIAIHPQPRQKISPAFVASLAGVFGLAFLAGGFSETALTLQGGLLAAGLAGVGLFSGRRILSEEAVRRRGTAVWSLAAALLGTILAVGVLLSAPLNQMRLMISYGAPNELLKALALALDSTRTFVQLTLYRSTLPYLFSGFFFFFLFFAWLAARPEPGPRAGLPPLRFVLLKAGAGLALAGGLGLGLIYASMLPGAYAESSYPGERALIVARYISLLVSASGGAVLGWLLWELVRRWKWGFVLPGSLAGALAGVWFWLLFQVQPVQAGEPAFPELRAFLQGAPGLLSLAAAAGVGLLAGCLLEFWQAELNSQQSARKSTEPRLFSPAALWMAGLLLVFQLGYANFQVYRQIQPLDQRAFLWDGRAAQIRQLQAQGQKEVTVQALDSLAGILELQDNPSHWVNRCAAGYYGLESLRAVEPVLTYP